MKTLLILRHAKSSWANANQSDHQRPLNARGRRDAPRMGKWLLAQDLTPDLIVASTAERAMSTAELVALACDYQHEIVYTRALYLAPPSTYLAVVREVARDEACVMVVGHNPGIEELVYHCSGVDEHMPTAALAHVTFTLDNWSEWDEDTSSYLHNIWRPKELDSV